MSNRITTRDELRAMTPDEIVAADDAGLVDYEAIARHQRRARQARAARTAAGRYAARQALADGASPEDALKAAMRAMTPGDPAA